MAEAPEISFQGRRTEGGGDVDGRPTNCWQTHDGGSALGGGEAVATGLDPPAGGAPWAATRYRQDGGDGEGGGARLGGAGAGGARAGASAAVPSARRRRRGAGRRPRAGGAPAGRERREGRRSAGPGRERRRRARGDGGGARGRGSAGRAGEGYRELASRGATHGEG